MSARSAHAIPEAAIWQDVEFGSYVADLPLWEQLAADSAGKVLELGAGAGRVSMHLARHGAELIAIERDPDLAGELERRAGQQELPVRVVEADASQLGGLGLEPSPTLAIAPLHLFQQLDPADRPGLLAELAALLGTGGRLAVTLVDESSFLETGVRDGPAEPESPRPDLREVDRWVYSSEPLWVQVAEQTLTVRRLRQVVSPEGELARSVEDELLHRISPEKLELDAEQAGYAPVARHPIRSGAREADSIGVVVEVA